MQKKPYSYFSFSVSLFSPNMAKPQMIRNFLLLSRRSHAVTTENPSIQAVTSVLRQAKELKAEDVASEQKQNFWMRDPKTGNWIPESHFGEIDVAEEREKILCKKEIIY